jgi:hypothetical protein
MPNEELLHVVQAMLAGDDHWSIRGVYSKREDAVQLHAELDRNPRYMGPVIETMTFEQIANQLIRDRLAPLAALKAVHPTLAKIVA